MQGLSKKAVRPERNELRIKYSTSFIGEWRWWKSVKRTFKEVIFDGIRSVWNKRVGNPFPFASMVANAAYASWSLKKINGASLLNATPTYVGSYIIVPEGIQRVTVKAADTTSSVDPLVDVFFPDYPGINNLVYEFDSTKAGMYYVNVNNSYKVCPAITVGVSSPIFQKNDTLRGGATPTYSMCAMIPKSGEGSEVTTLAMVPTIRPVLAISRYPCDNAENTAKAMKSLVVVGGVNSAYQTFLHSLSTDIHFLCKSDIFK